MPADLDRYLRAFRRIVSENYDYRCAASGWRIILPEGRVMVEAAHLIPFAETRDDDPRNGIALAPTFHWALDACIYTRPRLRLARVQGAGRACGGQPAAARAGGEDADAAEGEGVVAEEGSVGVEGWASIRELSGGAGAFLLTNSVYPPPISPRQDSTFAGRWINAIRSRLNRSA